jgi:hypothetical protein
MPAASDGLVSRAVQKKHTNIAVTTGVPTSGFPCTTDLRLMPTSARVSPTCPVTARMPCGSPSGWTALSSRSLAPEARARSGFAVASCRGHRARLREDRFTGLVVPPPRSPTRTRCSRRPSHSGPRKRRWPTPLVGRHVSICTLDDILRLVDIDASVSRTASDGLAAELYFADRTLYVLGRASVRCVAFGIGAG